jgi:hypothetical protein
LIGVVCALLEIGPLLIDLVEDATAIDDGRDVGSGHRSPVRKGESTWVRLVHEDVVQVDIWGTNNITGDIGNVADNVGVGVPTSKMGQVPVGLNGGNDRVVRVESVIGGVDQVLGESVGDEDGHDTVTDGVGLILIEVDDQEGVVEEVLVANERENELDQPISTIGDSSVVSIVQHVGGDERVLGKLVVV